MRSFCPFLSVGDITQTPTLLYCSHVTIVSNHQQLHYLFTNWWASNNENEIIGILHKSPFVRLTSDRPVPFTEGQ